MDHFKTHAPDVSGKTPLVPTLLAIVTASSVLLSGLNALLQILKVAIELAHHG